MEVLSCAGLRGEEGSLIQVIILDSTLAVVFWELCGKGDPRGPRMGKEGLLTAGLRSCVLSRCKNENECLLQKARTVCITQSPAYVELWGLWYTSTLHQKTSFLSEK